MFLIILFLFTSCVKNSVFWLDETDLSLMTSGNGTHELQANKNFQGGPLHIAGVEFPRGIGTSTISCIMLELNGDAKEIRGKAGVDDVAKRNSAVKFYIIGDRKTLWESGEMKRGDSARSFHLKLKGFRKLGLLVTDSGNGVILDYADWVDVSILYRGKAPSVPDYLQEQPYLLTPPPPAEPRINGPSVYGVRPGSPFLYRIPCTGERPVRFIVSGLPEGLNLDTLSGIITGKIAIAGTYQTVLLARNNKGESRKDFKIITGDQLMLTPSMGWNSWYIHKRNVSDSVMRNAADIMISSGMADYGYDYINIDGCWNVTPGSDDPIIGGPVRNRDGKLRGNKRFPDMKSLTDYIHSKGLKAGIYSSPGKTDCAGSEGSYGHEALDARTFADWGFDFLKYDWCNYELLTPDHTRASLKAPFELMRKELDRQNRDIVFNICQYGMGKVWEWAGKIGHSWRTTDDLGWMKNLSMPGFYYIGRSNADHWQYAGPGKWNDPDYILIGYIRDPFRKNQVFKASLTQSEQYFYMSMWSLMAAPLIFSGDMGKLDEYNLNVLCNSEVIDINLDPLGKQGRIIREGNGEMVMVKELENGDLAAGLFHVTGPVEDPAGFPLNKYKEKFEKEPVKEPSPAPDRSGYLNWGEPITIRVTAAELGLTSGFKVRDVWRQVDLGTFNTYFEAQVPYHGVSMIRISK